MNQRVIEPEGTLGVISVSGSRSVVLKCGSPWTSNISDPWGQNLIVMDVIAEPGTQLGPKFEASDMFAEGLLWQTGQMNSWTERQT